MDPDKDQTFGLGTRQAERYVPLRGENERTFLVRWKTTPSANAPYSPSRQYGPEKSQVLAQTKYQPFRKSKKK